MTQSVQFETALNLRPLNQVPTILIVDDDARIRDLIKVHLSSRYEVVETGEPENAVHLTISHRPDAILLDLAMPGTSGFEVCSALASLSFTRHIPIFIISGQDRRNSAFCLRLGASKYFPKPIDFVKLKEELAGILLESKHEQRSDARFPFRAILKLRTKGEDGSTLEIRAATENISSGGFLCVCDPPPDGVRLFEVFSCGASEHYLGQARLVRVDQAGTAKPRYAFHFEGIETVRESILPSHI